MNIQNIEAFFKFPGILIIIGIVLLIISILIGIFTYKKPKEEKEVKDDGNDTAIEIDNKEQIYDASSSMDNTKMQYNFFSNMPINDTALGMNINESNEEENIPDNALSINTNNSYNEEPIKENDNFINNYSEDNSLVIEEDKDQVKMDFPRPTIMENEETESIEDPSIDKEFEPLKETHNEEFNTGVFNIDDFKMNDEDVSHEEIELPKEEKPVVEESYPFSNLENENEEEITIDDIIAQKEKEEVKPVIEPIIEPVEVAKKVEIEDEEFEEPEITKPVPPKAIYGGKKPLENVTLNFNEDQHDAYSNTNFQPTGNIVTPLNDSTPKKKIEPTPIEEIPVKEEQDDDLELL